MSRAGRSRGWRLARGRTGRMFRAMSDPCATDLMADLVAEVRLTSQQRIEGHVFDPNRLDARFVVELYVDGQPAAIARAEVYDDQLRERGVGDGCYRFAFAIGHLSVESGS